MSSLQVHLSEWQHLRPEDNERLRKRTLGDDEAARRLVEELAASGRIEVLEMAKGLEFRATSFVGRLRLGEVTVTVEPKLSGAPFLHLLRYAYGMRHLDLHAGTDYATRSRTFLDLLVHQLATEAEELIRRGLHRDYLRREENLASPRGRIDFGRVIQGWQRGASTIPCVHHPRSEDNVLNRALLAALEHAAHLTTDLGLRTDVWRLATMLKGRVPSSPLSHHLLDEANAAVDRRTRTYEPVLVLGEILLRGEGAALDEDAAHVQLPGFLFDMNLFFQRLVSRFLHEHLDGLAVEDEGRMKELFRYDSSRNPQRRRAPVQKPDFLVWENNQVAAVLDAKYRDLWETSLPRDMLYQLALYALGSRGGPRCAAILYPTLSEEAREQAVLLREPSRGGALGEVALRPVHLLRLDVLLNDRSKHGLAARRALAREWAFGDAT